MSQTKLISNVLGLGLAGFFALCAQAHVTDKLTPAFSRLVNASTEPLNTKVLSFLGLSTGALNNVLLAIDIGLLSLLVRPRTRKAGLGASLLFLTISLYGDYATGQPMAAHLVLIPCALAAHILR